MIDHAVASLEHAVYWRGPLSRPDHFNVRHSVMMAHCQVDPLQRVVAGASGAVSKIIQIMERGLWRLYSQAKMMKFEAVAIHGGSRASEPPRGRCDPGAGARSSPTVRISAATRAAHCSLTRGLGWTSSEK